MANQHRKAKIFFGLYLAAVLYLSLYPWVVLPQPRTPALFWIPIAGRRQVLDSILNIFFYVPLGAAGFLSTRRGKPGWLFAVAFGVAVSLSVEWLQLWSPRRYGNLTDLAANSLGAIVGASAAYQAVRLRWFQHGISSAGVVSRWKLLPPQVLTVTVWVLWQTFPMIPELSLPRIWALRDPSIPWSWHTLAETGLGFAVLRWGVGRSPWVWVAFAALLAQAFLVEHVLTPAALLGAGLGWSIAASTGDRGWRMAGLLLPLWLVFEELRPFAFSPQRNAFGWIPFQSWYDVASAAYYPVIFGKLFFYLAAVRGLRDQRLGWTVATGIPLLILGTGEALQQYLPGRTPESTDVVLLLAGTALLRLCGSETEEFLMQGEQQQIQGL